MNDSADHDSASRPLNVAFQQALGFPMSKASDLIISAKQAMESAEQEAAFGTVSIDDAGLSSGMRLALIQPIRAVMAEWRQVRQGFITLLQPFMPDIQAVEKLQAEAQVLIGKKNEELEAVERELRQSPQYEDIDNHKRGATMLYESFVNRYSNRAAVMFARTPFYWFLIFLIGVTEWFINYHAFMTFFGIPALAAGTTIVLAALLAAASHGHGEVLRQWSYRFSPARDPAQRWSDWRIFGLCTVSFLVVLGFTGGARYAAAMELMSSQDQTSALGDLGRIDINPLRDVMISLLANVGAWLVGVFISYNAHDIDPDYMAATRQYRRAVKRWAKARASQVVRLKHIEAKYAQEIGNKNAAAQTRLAAVSHEIDMLNQVNAHDAAIRRELQLAIGNNAETYRDALARIAMTSAGKVNLVRGDARTPISPFEYKTMQIVPEQVISQATAALAAE